MKRAAFPDEHGAPGAPGAPASGRHASRRLAVPDAAAGLARLVLVALAVTVAAQASAEQPRRAKGAKPEARKPNPCASYGPGFTQVPGSSTCVRIGGSVQGDLSVGRGSAPNLGIK